MNLGIIWKKLKGKNKKSKQTTFMYCTCNNELISSDSFISDDMDGVKYKCTKCNRVSIWNFDLFPIPVDNTDGKYPTPRKMGLSV